jgi:hypothetical protein
MGGAQDAAREREEGRGFKLCPLCRGRPRQRKLGVEGGTQMGVAWEWDEGFGHQAQVN